jgi:hypothetical protein
LFPQQELIKENEMRKKFLFGLTLLVLVLVWVFTATIVFFLSQGTDVIVEITPDYRVANWPGFLLRHDPNTNSWIGYPPDVNESQPFPHGIDRFAVSDGFIIAKAKDGWLAIEESTGKIWYPYADLDILEKQINIKVSDLPFKGKISDLKVVIYNRTWIAIGIISVIFISIILITIWLFFFKKNRRPTNKVVQ